MKSLIIFLTINFCISLMSCSIEPNPIDYGSDGCHYCKMTIVDKRHAAQLVTNKGKAFKYDAIECMVNDLQSKDLSTISLYLINDYYSPGKLIDATNSTFLVSKSIPSPMGEYLSGFSNEEIATRVKKENTGQLYNWQELLEKNK